MTEQEENQLAITSAAKVFVAANPDYRRDPKVTDLMVDYMLENNFPQTDAESWQRAYDQICMDNVAYDTCKFLGDGRREIYFDDEAIEKMPADEMKRRLKNDPLFSRGVNLLGDKQ